MEKISFLKSFLKILLISTVILISNSAYAIVFGGSNLGFLGYPEMTCRKPTKPIYRDEFSVNTYNSDAERYIKCVNEYLENSRNDINRIKEKMQESIDAAKSNY